MKKLLSLLLSFVMVCSCMICFPIISVNSATTSQQNIVGWADYYYDITWTAQKTVSGWKGNYTYYQGNSYRLPYGQPVTQGKYIGYGVSIDDFISATKDANSAFYSTKSYYSGYSSNSVYYATDCSAFVSLCWGIPRSTTSSIPSRATGLGKLSSSTVNSLQIGDCLNSTSAGHVVLVTDVTYSGGTVTSVEITEQTPPQLKRTTYNASSLVSYYGARGYYIYRYNGTVPTPPSQEPVNNPTGVVDSIAAGPNSVTVRGWAFDVDDINTQLNIHVYIGGNSSDSNAEGIGWITANTYRPDVDNVYGCGGYHGYEVTIPTSKTGSQPVYIYAINVGSGSNQLIGSSTVNISKDTEAPTISRTYLSEITKDGYRVCCETKDNVGIKKVRIATWTQSNQSDIIWHDANHNGTGTWFIDLKRSDYAESQVYFNHIYVYDYANNCAVAVKDMVYETNGPEITSQTVSNISSGGFRFTCKVKDETKVSSVRVAVWTDKNGQDDLKWYDFSVNGNIASRYICASDHNNETGSYIIHTYAYDKYDNRSSTSFATVVSATPIESTSVEYGGNMYKIYSSGMNWDEAKVWCEEQGGHLATITSKEEWQSVKSLLEKFNGVRCWLGAESTSGEWKWITGEKFEFSNWANNQPDCYKDEEFYLGTFDNTSEILDCYLWNDHTIVGDKIGGFVMEIEAPAQPETEAPSQEPTQAPTVEPTVYPTVVPTITPTTEPTQVPTVIPTNPPVKIGDADEDGIVNIFDATEIQLYLAKYKDLSDTQMIAADADKDGIVNIFDVTQIQLYLAKYITEF